MIQLPLRLTLYPYTTLFRSGERQPEVRLADTGGAIDDGERARQQAPTEHRVEPGNAGRDACAQSLHSTPGSPARSESPARPGSPARPFVWNWRSYRCRSSSSVVACPGDLSSRTRAMRAKRSASPERYVGLRWISLYSTSTTTSGRTRTV